MSFSDYFEVKVLDYFFGQTAYTVPATLYFGLATAEITDTTTGTTVTEPSGGDYARVAVTNADKTNWNNAAAGALTNKTDIEFPEATASWGTVTYMFIADAATVGNIIAWGALTASKAIGVGDNAKFAAGDLSIALD